MVTSQNVRPCVMVDSKSVLLCHMCVHASGLSKSHNQLSTGSNLLSFSQGITLIFFRKFWYRTVIFLLFLSNTNNLQTVIWFKVFQSNTNNFMVSSNYTVIWFKVPNNNHHHVMPLARISLTLSRHFSLSFITSDRSSELHPVSSLSCCMYVRAGCPAFARPYVGVHRSTSLMSSSLLL